jgi:uncharacterized protein YcbK (DUF882 family)
MTINLNKQLTQNFKLRDFILSDFYGDYQKKVIKSVTHPILANIHELADNLQVLRDYLNEPITINIGFRPLWWELQQGRSGTSQHVKGKAVDIVVSNTTPNEVAFAIEKLIRDERMSEGGLKACQTFTHYDIRKTKTRW